MEAERTSRVPQPRRLLEHRAGRSTILKGALHRKEHHTGRSTTTERSTAPERSIAPEGALSGRSIGPGGAPRREEHRIGWSIASAQRLTRVSQGNTSWRAWVSAPHRLRRGNKQPVCVRMRAEQHSTGPGPALQAPSSLGNAMTEGSRGGKNPGRRMRAGCGREARSEFR